VKIYFIGICGTATGNVAILLKSAGHDVRGSDKGIYEPMKSALENAGIACIQGWDYKNIADFKPDAIVVGNAISRLNAELEGALDASPAEIVSLPEIISQKLIADRPSLVISGTHGKTTTTGIAAYLLKENGFKPGWLIGGIPQDLSGGSELGGAKAPFVIEGDEYDSAFFDKRSKFIHYKPRVLVINNLEFDHADIFRDLLDVKRTFTHVRRIVHPKGLIIENGDDENISALEDTPWARRIKVGFGANCDLLIKDFSQDKNSSRFTLCHKGQERKVHWGLTGVYNARNAAMALAGAAAIVGKEPFDFDISSLAKFKGVKRRQQILFENENHVVIEDFAHHPTAIALTIEALRERYVGFKIYAAFEPRSNTAKTNVLEADFADALAKADKICIGAAPGAEKIPAERRIDTKRLANRHADKITAFTTNAKVLDAMQIYAHLEGGKKIYIFFSNGSFDDIHKAFAAFIAQ